MQKTAEMEEDRNTKRGITGGKIYRKSHRVNPHRKDRWRESPGRHRTVVEVTAKLSQRNSKGTRQLVTPPQNITTHLLFFARLYHHHTPQTIFLGCLWGELTLKWAYRFRMVAYLNTGFRILIGALPRPFLLSPMYLLYP